MKKQITVIFLILVSVSIHAQLLKPVKWEFKTNKITDSEYELQFIATIDNNWAVYSQNIKKGGPVPTSFEFESAKSYKLLGNVKEAKENKVSKNDPVFNMVVAKFYKRAVFTQKVKITNKTKVISGSLRFMTCDGEQCLPPNNVPFTFTF